MSVHYFLQDCAANVLTLGNTRMVVFIGNAAPDNLKWVFPNSADACVAIACNFLNLDDSERSLFRDYLLSEGFEK